MPEIEFKRDLNNNYLIMEIDGEISASDYQIRMITVNAIGGLLKCNTRILDGKIKLYFEITSKQPIARIYEKRMIGLEDIGKLIMGIKKGLESASEYLLDANSLILDPEYIYMNIGTGELYFCYLPYSGNEVSASFHKLTEYILERLDHGDRDGVMIGYELYMKTKGENYSLDAIMGEIITKMGKDQEAVREEADRPEPEDMTDTAGEEDYGLRKTLPVAGERPPQKSVWRPVKIAAGAAAIAAAGYAAMFRTDFFVEINPVKAGAALLVVGAVAVFAACRGRELKKAEKEYEDLVIDLGEEKRGERRDGMLLSNSLEPQCRPDAGKQADPGKNSDSGKHSDPGKHPDPGKRPDPANCQDTVKYQDTEDEKNLADSGCSDASERYGDTMLLAYRPNIQQRKLVGLDKEFGMEVPVQKFPFILGKMPDASDWVIRGEGVSRMHAEFSRDGNQYYVKDLNSTNGTFLNGTRLEANETRELNIGDEVCIGRIPFCFR